MTLSLWAGTFGVFAVLMVADLALTRKTAGFRTAATSSALWIAAALAFGGALATPLFVALVAIEVTDLVFAVDSIPAVDGVTRELFVVFTSNAFAVLGLRALYSLLASSVDRFGYLKQGIALLLVFIGTKMLISPLVHLPAWMSHAAIAVVAGGAVAASLWRDRARRPRHASAKADHAPEVRQTQGLVRR